MDVHNDQRLLLTVVLGTNLLSKVSCIHNGKLRSCFENFAGFDLSCKILSGTVYSRLFLNKINP